MSLDAEIQLLRDGHVAHIVLARAPHNHVDVDFMARLSGVLRGLDADEQCRAVVLSSGVSAFCAGADFGTAATGGERDPAAFYAQALKLFQNRKPIVAAIEGAAVGAGLGLALAVDFRVASASARFSANFNRLGFHPGFGLSATLPRLIGQQKAAWMFYTGQRVKGDEAAAIGLADACVPAGEALGRAMRWAREIAASAPLAVESTRETLRLGLFDAIVQANQRELDLQRRQFKTQDFREGVAAMAQRRTPIFHGR